MKGKPKRENSAMIIANPIYDVVFKYLMEDLDIAKGILSRILGEEIEALQFSASERALPVESSVISLHRMDFIALIRTADGSPKNILVEVQKAKLSGDVSRFRNYLGKQYMRRDEVVGADGRTVKASLPIVTIYILGFELSKALPATIKVKREYLDALTGKKLSERSAFIEALTHDSYIIQVPGLHPNMQNALERVLSVFEQNHFIDERGHEIEYIYDAEDPLLAEILRRLHSVIVKPEVRERMEIEDEAYAEFEAAIAEREATLTRQLRLTEEELEDIKQREEEAQKQKEEAQKQKEEAFAKLETAVEALVAAGIPRDQARKQLGLD